MRTRLAFVRKCLQEVCVLDVKCVYCRTDLSVISSSRFFNIFVNHQDNLRKDSPPGGGLQHLRGHGVSRRSRGDHLQGRGGL